MTEDIRYSIVYISITIFFHIEEFALMSPQPNQTKHDSYPLLVALGILETRDDVIKCSISRIIGPLWGESTGQWWIPLPKASDAKIWCFLWSVWTNVWANNRDAAELRRDRAHYDVTEMCDADQTIAIDQNMAWSQAFLLCSSFSFTVGNIGFKTLMGVSFSDIHWKNSCWFRFAFTEPWRH